MAMKTQGTDLYFLDKTHSGGADILPIGCVTAIGGIEVKRDQLETTCLDSISRTYDPGMPTPGPANFTINFDMSDDSHLRLLDLWKSGDKFDMAIGLEDGTAAPTIDTAGDFDLPTSRSFLTFTDVYIINVPMELQLNALITSNVSVQLSSFPTAFKKST